MNQKKWISLLVVLCSLITITIFYISSKEVDNLGRVQFTTLEGDASRVDHMVLKADLVSYTANQSKPIIIKKDTVALDEHNQMKSSYFNYEDSIAQYIESYPSFMRGKTLYLGNFAENDTSIYYVEDFYSSRRHEAITELSIDIEALDKESGEITVKEFNVQFEKAVQNVVFYGIYEWQGYLLLDVLLTDPEGYNDHNNYYVYDTKAAKVIDQFNTGDISDWGSSQLFLVDEKKGDFVLETRSYNEETDTLEENHLYSYNIVSQSFKELFFDNEAILNNEETIRHGQDGKLYYFVRDRKTIVVHVYDIATESFILKKEIDIDPEVFTEWAYIDVQKNSSDGSILLYEPTIQWDVEMDDKIGMMILDPETLELEFSGYLDYQYDDGRQYLSVKSLNI